MKTHDEIIAGYKEKIKLAQERKKKSEARQKALAKKVIKQKQQRLATLAGLMLLDRVKAGKWPVAKFEAAMAEFLVNDNDREFFKSVSDDYQPEDLQKISISDEKTSIPETAFNQDYQQTIDNE